MNTFFSAFLSNPLANFFVKAVALFLLSLCCISALVAQSLEGGVKGNVAGNTNAALNEVTNETVDAASVLLFQAESDIQHSRYEKALIALVEAYRITSSEVNNNANKEVNRQILNSMAHVYYDTDQFVQAERYYSELVKYDEEKQDKLALSVSLFNLGHVYGAQQTWAAAEQSFVRSLALSQELVDVSGASYTLKALGVISQQQQQYDAARQYLESALEGFELLRDDRQVASVLRNLGDVELAVRQYDAAVTYYEEALPVLATYSMNIALLEAYKGLSSSYAKLFDFEKAYFNHRFSVQLLQNQLEQKYLTTLQSLQVEFDAQHLTDENERLELLAQSQLLENEKLELQSQAQMLAIAWAATVIALGLVTLLWSRKNANDMKKLATIDELTGLLNRRAIMSFGLKEWQRSRRSGNPFSCLMFDIDHFKSINDTFGHAAGDKVLIKVASALQETLRATDALGRFGGEEFLLIATETEFEQTHLLAERIRQKVESIEHPELDGKAITVSIGFAQLSNEASLEDLIHHADLALYEAKESGRNKVNIFSHTKNARESQETMVGALVSA